MKTFKDTESREWQIAVNVASIKRVRDLAGVDLLAIVEGTLLERLAADPVMLVDVIYALCKPQSDQRQVTDEQFGQAMAGDAIEQATAGLLEELTDFFPNRRDRASLRRVLETTRGAMERARDLIEQRIESGEIEKIAEQALARLNGSSGAAPASSASTPAR